MKSYRRILVSIASGGEADLLLRRAAELAQVNQAQLLVVRVLDTRSGFAPDGPAVSLPGDTLARRVPETRRRLDLLLARNNLGCAESRVVWGEPQAMLEDSIRAWEPDLVIASERHQPRKLANGADTLVVAGPSWLSRLLGAWSPLPATAQ